jgi:phosphonate transport system permease protein
MAESTLKSDGTPASAPLAPDVLRDHLLRVWPSLSWRGLMIVLAAIAILSWSFSSTETSVGDFIGGFDDIWYFLVRLFPPDWDWQYGTAFTVNVLGREIELGWPRMINSVVETIQISIIGTLGAALLAVPVSLLAARNISPHPMIYQVTRLILNVLRSIPELIYALVFVAAVGLGPFPGVLALTFGSIGSLSRLYAEAIEQIDPQQVMAVRATGASGLQTFMYAVLPQALPLMLSYSLVYFEHNVRNASILGIVGAGGVGFWLQYYLSTFQYDMMLGTVIILVVAVTVIDRFSNYVRQRFI